jgi:hypothetical protein
MRVAVLALVIAAVGLPATARAQRCVRIAGGLYESPGCRPSSGRAGDRGEAAFWQEKFEGRKRDPAADVPLVMPPGGRFPSTWPLPRSAAREGATTLDDLQLKPDGRGGYRGRRPGFHFGIDADGTVHFEDRPSIQLGAFLLVGLVGAFDVTDLVMRLHGDDPYAYDKALVLGLTRPMRDKMTDSDRQRRVRRALAALPRDLDALWARPDLPAPERRELLFRLWDELLEEDEAGTSGRNTIVDFIQRKLPAGSAEAFTGDEVVRYNSGRKSQAAFAPYR